jgi:hypothetical protein
MDLDTLLRLIAWLTVALALVAPTADVFSRRARRILDGGAPLTECQSERASTFPVFDCDRSGGVLRCAGLVLRSSWMLCVAGGVAPPQRLSFHSSGGALFQAR